jgi:hypothetical protein
LHLHTCLLIFAPYGTLLSGVGVIFGPCNVIWNKLWIISLDWFDLLSLLKEGWHFGMLADVCNF